MANKLLTLCVATGLATVLSLATTTSGSAADWGSGNWRATAIGAGIAGVAVGAAAAAASSPYGGSGYYGSGYYAYAPGYARGGAIGSSGLIYDTAGAGWSYQGRDDCRFNINNC